jgi:hypothetical protein
MNAVEALRRAIDHSHRWFDGTTSDVTQEQADYLPAGMAHPIGELMAHVIQSEDGIINGICQGKPTVWESGGWEQKLGVPNVMGHTTEMARGFKCDLKALEPYKEAVYASTQAYLDGIDEAELDREAEGPFGKATVLDFLTNALIGNNLAHTGEISALKGLQGAKGYPF